VDIAEGHQVKVSLIVIRCSDLNSCKNFYEKLGLSFVKEQHGSGPVHYSSILGDTVFELYPLKSSSNIEHTRLGFCLPNVNEIIKSVTPEAIYENDGRKIYVVVDPDGRKIEIS
jgi:lactoylglutathione lyase